ncbi:MAG: beta-N-acetylhexosaminidase [Melioribacteraceae bacterium]|nr:beta-N-acetylhexosaminidase [Melioribacteraceae bacterium]
MTKKFFLILILTGIFNLSIGQTMNSNQIIPNPKKILFENDSFLTISKDLKFIFSGFNETELKSAVNEINQSLDLINITKESKQSEIIFSKVDEIISENGLLDFQKEQAYRLTIQEDKILVEAQNPQAAFWGAMSLCQLIEKSENGMIKTAEIVDCPDLKVRGISDDISRGQVSTLENFKRIIRFIARYKMNTYMPYLEDMLEFDSFPSIGENRGKLTKDEVKELVAYADEYHVEVIPIFQTLGHYENILAKEEFLKYAEFPGAASLCVSCDETYEFIETMLKEVFEMFPSKYFHMGADESWDVGLGKSKHLVEKSNIAKVHADHYQKVYDICKKYGKEVLMYGDIILNHPEILDYLPKDITIVDWHYSINDFYESTKTFSEAGHNYFVSPSVWNFLTTFPANINAIPNIKYIIKSGLQYNAGGMINSNWGDYGAETIKELILFGYAYSAAVAWSYDETDASELSNSFFTDFFGIPNSNFSEVYETLAHPFNQMMWHEVWRHPLLPFRQPVWWEPKVNKAAQVSWMEYSLPKVDNTIEQLKRKVKKNEDHLEIIELILELNRTYKYKVETQFLLHDKLKGVSVNSDELISMIDKNIENFANLKKNFENIWLKYYKEANLWMIKDKIDRLIQYLEETKAAVKNDNLEIPLAKSEWIYCKVNDSTFAEKAEFIKKVNLDKVDEAVIQLIGDTYSKLYINGKYVDEIYVRRSLSLYTEYDRIKTLDVKEFLTTGENEIKIISEIFADDGKAGFNLVGRINGEMIYSDESWKAKPFDSQMEYTNAVKQNYRYELIQPNFDAKRTSWIER